TDDTQQAVRCWEEKSPFPIIYVRQENSGKHVAVNRGVTLARGELTLILDSDDWLVPQALERVLHWWDSIPAAARQKYAGVAGLCAFPSGELVGTRFPQDVMDSDSIEIRVRYKVKGDKCEVWRTDVLRQFPFPEDLGRFVTEALVWNRISCHYKLKFVNEIWMIKDYQPEGLTAKSLEVRAKAPRAAMLYYKEFAEMERPDIPVPRRLREYANYTRFSFHAGVSLPRQAQAAKLKWLWIMAAPVGVCLYLRDRVILARRRRCKRK
ncbi:MAG: glycosyltransferase family 2 protein, partial [Candidatus Bipolaricaulota bacterium]|nr:glycosyltransferase family 2 protein [Candidatus Bipolaricaulota bacterium]MDW8127391.1 glycosyltransferase family A protein [Candidatus Bipolaricaulota bacterium]